MPEGFVIMQIGDQQLDEVYDRVVAPAIEECGLAPRRVDRDNRGRLLKSEIVDFIGRAEVIVADLTNERPNCYLEVGYTMGLDRFTHLILTARQDHLPGHPDHVQGGPKVHFDLAGYDILFWDPDDLESFKETLVQRIERRRAVLAPSEATEPRRWDEAWISEQRDAAMTGLNETGFETHMELSHSITASGLEVRQGTLVDAARDAEIRTFGWPIGVVFRGGEEIGPKPRADGIVAEVRGHISGPSFDYWALRRNGDFFLLKSVFEDLRDPTAIFFNTRIVRIAESLLHCARLYQRLDVAGDREINIRIKHGGIAGRVLSASSPVRQLSRAYRATVDEIVSERSVALERMEAELVDVVKSFTEPLFMMFDFFELSDKVLGDIVDAFVEGRIV